jgi:hypothetical protein
MFAPTRRLIFTIVVRILHDYREAEKVLQEVSFSGLQKVRALNSTKGTANAWAGLQDGLSAVPQGEVVSE